MKKAMLLLLAAVMLLPLFASCSEKPKTPSGTETAAPASPAADIQPETEEKGLSFVDSVPEMDFNGETFDILQYSKNNWFYVEDQNGEQLNDIVYERNRTLEERFNITIEEPTTAAPSALIDMAALLVAAGDDQYEIVSQSIVWGGNTLSRDILRNVLALPYIDLDNPWYTQGLEDTIVADKLLFLTGDYTLSYTAGTVVVYFNKAKWIDYLHNTEDLYQIVRDGKWTLDRLMGYCVDMYNDVNGNGKRDEDDFYGFASDYVASVNAFIYGSDLRRIEIVGDDYVIEPHILDEKMIDMYTKLRYLMTDSVGAPSFILYRDNNDTNNSVFFYTGNALFTSLSVNKMTSPEMVDMKDDFGVLPVPKWDEDQQQYYTNIDIDTSDVIGVLKTVQNTEMVGAVIEAMSAMSYTYVMPLYCQSVLELRAARDPESSEMLRMVMDTRVMDWETLYAGTGGWLTRQRKIVNTANCPEIVSGIVERLNEIQNFYESYMDLLWYME